MPHGWLASWSTPGTCCKIWVSSFAVAGWITRRDVAGRARGTRDEPGLHPDPAVGDRGVDAGHLDRVDVDALPVRQRVPLVGPPLGYRVEHARRLAGQAQPGVLAEAERTQVVVLHLRRDRFDDLRHADVTGVRDDSRDRVSLAAM